MSVDVVVPERAVSPATWLTIRLGGAMMAGGGRLSVDEALALAEATLIELPTSRGRRTPRQRLREALRPLCADEVIVLIDDAWYAPDVTDLGAWLADALEARADSGLVNNPTLPRARSAA